MSVPWFIAAPEDWTDDEIRLPSDESHHALKVLRVAPPDVITVTDGKGVVAQCASARIDDGRLVAEILERTEHRAVKPQVVVYQGAGKGAKADEVIERVAELGASEAWVYESERSVVRWSDDKVARLADRWRAIARATAKQSRNPLVMATGSVLSWTEFVRRVAKEQFAVVLWEEASLPLRTALVDVADRVAVVVGPEGGLTREEAEALADTGAQLASLGPRILRTENAPVVAVAALLYHYGLIG
ncbi:MAG: RsmE family RNA methyltransferase [Actinomycetota bacterium]